jgi:hypothetical protein
MITQEQLKELLHYDPDTGFFTWKVRRKGVALGSEAGTNAKKKQKYYRQINIESTLYLSHRLAWLYVHGKFPDGQIDHIDGEGLNNRITNLRDVTNRENSMNRRIPINNNSGVIGVSFDKQNGKWLAQISTELGNKNLGRFADIEGAVAARKAADIKYGYHENHGSTRVINVEQEIKQ